MLRGLHVRIRAHREIKDVWHDSTFQGLHISPILGALLTCQPPPALADAGRRGTELFRLAAIVYLSGIRARFGFDTGYQTSLYSCKLLALLPSLTDDDVITMRSHGYLLWALTVPAVSRCLPPDVRPEILHNLAHEMRTASLSTFQAVLASLQQLAWDEEILDTETERLYHIWQQAA